MAITITGNPGVPSLSDPANFNNDALTFLTWLTKNTSGGFIYQLENLDAADFFSVLGTVSQSGGTPTGALMERGSNVNGEYVRFADGTQICTKTDFSVPFAFGSTCSATWDYSANFVSGSVTNIGFVILEDSGSFTPSVTELAPGGVGSIGNNKVQIRIRRINGMTDFLSGDTVVVRPFAIGRWF